VVAGLALTAAVVLGLVVMYWLQLKSADRTIDGQLRTYATQLEESAASWYKSGTLRRKITHIHRMKSVHIFFRGDRQQDFLGIHMRGQRKLYQDSVNFISAVQ